MIKKMAGLVFLLAIGHNVYSQQQADLIVYNTTIYTVDSVFSMAEAMAIKDGKILETGTVRYIGENYRTKESIDLQGKYVYPGFNDAHAHFMGYAGTLNSVNLVGTQSFEEVIERIRSFQEEHHVKFITGRGWDQNDWEVKEFPNKEKLDALFPEIPVYIKRIDGHAALANQAALDFAGIDTTTRIRGGIIQQENGKLTGILMDNAMTLIQPPAIETAQMVAALEKAEDKVFEAGLTSLSDAGLDRAQIELLDSLLRSGILKIRVNAMVSDSPGLQEYYLKKGKIKTDHLNVQSFKFYLDGALGSRGALMLNDYSDDSGNVGLKMAAFDHYLASAKKLKASGWQMCIHAIGDSANRLALDVYEEVLDIESDHRWRIEHAQIVAPVDVKRFGKLHVIPSVQPTHATSDMYWAEERLGAGRMKDAYPYQSLLKSAGILALGTDFPVEDIDPLQTFYAAVFRQDENLFPKGGFIPQEKLSREEALRGMTIWPAYAAFEEDEKGSLEAGKWADFVVLDKDIMKATQQEIIDANVIMTFSGGELVYRKMD